MRKKRICLIFLGLMLSLAGTASANLVGHWQFDEDSGATAADSSGNGYDGSLFGDPQWIIGYLDGGLEFDGNGDYVDLPISPLLGSLTNSTFALWVDFSNEGGAWQRIFDFGINETFNMFLTPRTDTGGPMRFAITITGWTDEDQTTAPATLASGWHHVVVTLNADNDTHTLYLDGDIVAENTSTRYTPSDLGETTQNWLGRSQYGADAYFDGSLDDFRIYNRVLTPGHVEGLFSGIAPDFAQAHSPIPADGALHPDTWANISWKPGDFAVSHDVYFGDNFDSVNNGTRDSDVFRANQASVYYVVGFPGFPLPEGLVPGTTYYWRIDEVNDSNPNSPWKGPIWSFSIPPKKAYNPVPVDGAESVPLNAQLTWTPGLGAKLHTISFGDDFDTVANAVVGVPAGAGIYDPGPLKEAKIYYWRVDEFDGIATYQGDVWRFSTVGAIANPNPSDGAVDITQTPLLRWTASVFASSHEIYFGTDPEAVKNATKASPEYKATKALGDETYDPGKLAWNTSYCWRVDEVNDIHPESPWKGPVWSFTTGDFAIVDDFESYTDDDAAGEAIWQSWIDGFGVDDNGAQVGYLVPSYAEQTIVHGGSQSMPLFYNNEAGVTNSEAALTLTSVRDWTEEGVVDLSLWFQGTSANAAEPLYVAVSNAAGSPAVVANADPLAATIDAWTEWRVPLQAFADQGINLGNVDKIAIGLGSKGGAAAGGAGTVYVDDIRLYRP